MESKNKKLRSGYTTGACAAAAAKAATLLLLGSKLGVRSSEKILEVDIPFPNGSRVRFKIHHTELQTHNSELISTASVIKDAGDDPDITNGAEIVAAVQSSELGVQRAEYSGITIRGGKGVGTVTKPGLAVAVGEAAINPVPRKMIGDAVHEAVRECGMKTSALEVTISVPAGAELAKKTLNHRLGIVGGISILGTTGIVRPLSEEAWTATITASFDVAKALGLTEVVISTGRTSEKAHQQKYGLPAEAYAMMGDFTEFSLRDAAKHKFSRVHLCAQWAKMIKIAMATPQTHVRHGALEAVVARDFLVKLGIGIPQQNRYNTTREILEFIRAELLDSESSLMKVCEAAKRYAEGATSGIPVAVHLVSYEGEILAASE